MQFKFSCDHSELSRGKAQQDMLKRPNSTRICKKQSRIRSYSSRVQVGRGCSRGFVHRRRETIDRKKPNK